jgi:hypothetical protein
MTIVGDFKDITGQVLPRRGLLDSGSQINIVKTSFIHQLKLVPTGGKPPQAGAFDNSLRLRNEYLLPIQIKDSTG